MVGLVVFWRLTGSRLIRISWLLVVLGLERGGGGGKKVQKGFNRRPTKGFNRRWRGAEDRRCRSEEPVTSDTAAASPGPGAPATADAGTFFFLVGLLLNGFQSLCLRGKRFKRGSIGGPQRATFNGDDGLDHVRER